MATSSQRRGYGSRLRGARGILSGLAVTSLLAAPVSAAEEPPRAADESVSPQQRQAIEAIIRDYIADHPEVVIDAIQAYQAQMQREQQQQAEAALQESEDDLLNDPRTPVAGNPDGDVTIVEFFDYNCGYCKQVLPSIQTLLETDENVRYVFKEFPILGAGSVVASRAALAVWNLSPEKYLPFHVALMNSRGSVSEQHVFGVAEQVGVDPEALKAEMQEPEIDEKIRDNIALGQRIGIRGTPAFIINDQIVPGAVSLDALRDLVGAAREG